MKTLIPLIFIVAGSSAHVLPSWNKYFPFISPMSLGDLEGRITNGKIAARGQFPYQVGLRIIYRGKSAWCGGTLISDRWILTAAHCTVNADGVTVYLGAFDIKNDNEEGQQRVNASKANIFVHANYTSTKLNDDISLIKLSAAVQFNELIRPAALPKKSANYSTYEGNLVLASGWGRESDSSHSVSQFLRYIEVPVLKQSTCSSYYFGQVTDKMICIKTTGKKSTCNGDSGGPLVYNDKGVNTVIGATSFGIVLGCEKGWPGVFTRITAYLDWIEEISGITINSVN